MAKIIHDIVCCHPDHDSREGEEGWSAVLGTCGLPDDAPQSQIDRALSGYYCAACTPFIAEEA
jgi:hypothetical protein